jgi:hypothetical protein
LAIFDPCVTGAGAGPPKFPMCQSGFSILCSARGGHTPSRRVGPRDAVSLFSYPQHRIMIHDHEFLDAEFVCRGKTEASAGGGRIFTLSLASRTRHDADRSHAYSRTPDTCVRPRSIQGQIKEIDRCIVHSCGSLYSTHQPWIRLQTPLLRASQPAVPIAIPIAFWGQRGFWACTGASQTLPASFRA